MELAIAKSSISTLSPIINKLGSYVYDSYFGGDVTAEDMEDLTVKIIPTIKTVIEEAELVPLHHLGPWLEKLQEVAMEAEDLMDLYDYNKIKNQVSSVPKFIKTSIVKTKETMGFMLPKSPLKASFEKLQKSAEEARGVLRPLIESARITAMKKSKSKSPQDSYSTSTTSTPPSHIFGRKRECDLIIKFLLDESHADSNGRIERIPIIAIRGIGGSGKTTAAQSIYNDERLEIFDLKMWVYVSRSFDVHRLTKEIIEAATKKECPRMGNSDVLETTLKESIKAKKFLLVLDDIWCEDKIQWDQLLSPLNEAKGNGSKIIITTRMKEVASNLRVDQAISLEELTMEDCWSILKHYAFHDSEATIGDTELADIGDQIISKVRYSPLALRIVGSLMGKQRIGVNEWENILRGDILKGTMDVLLLSFQHLPSHLQRCFAYCSLFPKGYKFSINCENLVPLWIAQGFVENINESELTLEEKGRTYIEELISYSFFEIEIEYGCYKMHDLLHDLAEKVSKKYCHRIEDDSSNVPATCIHLSVYWDDNFKKVDIPDLSKLKKLRSLIILDHSFYTNNFENKKDIFQNLGKLRALHVESKFEVEALSYIHVCKLKHLRYLNLRCWGKFSELQLAKLYHLQFLHCGFIDYSFAQSVCNLINLRTLKFYNSDFAPSNLESFYPTKNDVNGMMPLKNLNLEGSLSIRSLENVKSETEAAKAMLNKKKNLNELTFEWSNTLNSIDGLNSCEDVLEGLEPHLNLKRLSIMSYQGVKAPNWMKNENWLPRLCYLFLFRCRSLKEVPYLPPHLEELWIQECNELMQLPPIGDTLCTLKLVDCSKLMPPSMSNKSLRLSEIVIKRCSGNESQLFNDLPFLSNLQHLELEGFSNLETFPNLSPTVTTLYIKDFPKLASMGSLQHYTSLSYLTIKSCPMLTCLESLQYCISLTWLGIIECPMLTGLEGLLYCTSLTGLLIRECPMLTGLEGLQYCTSLSRLTIESCPMLTGLEGLQYCTSLTKLRIESCPMLTGLEGLQYCTSLSRLTIESCPMLTGLEGLQYCTSLTKLRIESCPMLTGLEGLQYCTSLTWLSLRECPMLTGLVGLPISLKLLDVGGRVLNLTRDPRFENPRYQPKSEI